MCKCEYVCASFSDRLYLSSPLPSPKSLSTPSSIQTATWCVSHVQSLNAISLPGETLYLLQLYRVRGISQCWSFLTALKVTHSAFRYCIYEAEQWQEPLLTSGPLFWRFLSGDSLPCWLCVASVLSPRVQGEYKRFWIVILRASLIHRADWDIYHMGSKGQGGLPLLDYLTFVKHLCHCGS